MPLYDTFDDMWYGVINDLKVLGSPLQSRVGPCQEILGYSATVRDPSTIMTLRRFDPAYAAAELLWYLSWSDDGTMLQHYAPSYVRFLRPDENGVLRAYGAYGQRWYGQLNGIVEKLRRDPNTRQTVLATWKSGDSTAVTPDVPCTLTLQFLLRGDRLHMVVTMRSNDAWLGMPYDTFAFSRLQRIVADVLQVELGQYTHQVGSLHLYDKNFDEAQAAIKNERIEYDTREFYRRIGYMAVEDAAWKATSMERLLRQGKRGVYSARSMLETTLLERTELGAMVVLCASKSDATLPDRPIDVDPILWHLLRERRRQL